MVLAGKPNIPFVWDHNQGLPPFATTGSGTLKLTPDARGLHVIAELDDDHFMSGTLKSMIRRGDVRGMSFGFIAGPGNSRMEHRGDRPHRIITNFRAITDVCTTWQPAYAGTTAELRSAIAAYGDVPADAQVALAQAITHEPAPEWRLTDTVSQPADEGASPQLEAGAKEGRAEDAGTGAEETRNANEDAVMLAAAARRRTLELLGARFPDPVIPTERTAP